MPRLRKRCKRALLSEVACDYGHVNSKSVDEVFNVDWSDHQYGRDLHQPLICHLVDAVLCAWPLQSPTTSRMCIQARFICACYVCVWTQTCSFRLDGSQIDQLETHAVQNLVTFSGTRAARQATAIKGARPTTTGRAATSTPPPIFTPPTLLPTRPPRSRRPPPPLGQPLPPWTWTHPRRTPRALPATFGPFPVWSCTRWTWTQVLFEMCLLMVPARWKSGLSWMAVWLMC